MPYIPVDQREGNTGTGSGMYVPIDQRAPVAPKPPEKPGIFSRIKSFFGGTAEPAAPVAERPQYIPVSERGAAQATSPEPEMKLDAIIPTTSTDKPWLAPINPEKMMSAPEMAGNFIKDKVLNRPEVQKGLTTFAETTRNLPAKAILKGYALLKGRGEQEYSKAYEQFKQVAANPNTPAFDKFVISTQNAVPQTAIGVLLAVGSTAITKNPAVGKTVAGAYWSALSAEGQIQEKGKVDSISNIAIDVAGDTILGNYIGSLLRQPKNVLKKTIADYAKTMTRAGAVEGGTEVMQTLLKNANDFQGAKTPEERATIIEKTKQYVKNGDILMEFGVGAVSGGVIAGAASAIPSAKEAGDPIVNVEKPTVAAVPPKERVTISETPIPGQVYTPVEQRKEPVIQIQAGPTPKDPITMKGEVVVPKAEQVIEVPKPKAAIAPPTATKVSQPIADNLRDKVGTTIEKATAKQVSAALYDTKETIEGESAVLEKKLGKQKFSDERFFGSYAKDELIAAAARGEFLTDSYMAIMKKDVSDPIFAKMVEAEVKKQTRGWVKQGLTVPDAEAAARKEVAGNIERIKNDKDIVPPDLNLVIPKKHGTKPVTVDGYVSAGKDIIGVSISDGTNREIVNGDMFAYMKKALPDAKIYLTEKNRPVVFKEGKKIVGVIMPIRSDKNPFDVKKEAPKAEVVAPKPKPAPLPKKEKPKPAVLAKKEDSKPAKKESIKITHFTKKENIESILAKGFDATLPPIHGTGGLEGGAKTGKAAEDVLYFTTDNDRWKSAVVFVGEGKGTISKKSFDYDAQKWIEEKNAYAKIDLSPIEATVKDDAKILEVDSLAKVQELIGKIDPYNTIQDIVAAGRKGGYDIVHIENKGGVAWEYPDGRTNKMGDKNWYNTLTGNSGKSDYFVLNRNAIEITPKKPSLPRTPVGASGARGGTKIDDFESRIGEPTKEKNPDFKLYQKVEELIRKYAVRVGEGYTEGNAGLFYHNTQTIRLNGMNNLSVAAHEITHRLDMLNKISNRLMRIAGYTDAGKPIYDRETASLRKELTDMYERNYPGARREHPLKKRMVEGYATLLQKYVEAPITTEQNYPNIVHEMLKPGGEHYAPVIGEIIADLQNIIEDYQGLSALDKVGARVTSDLNQTGKKSFLTGEDLIRTEVADEVFPIEKLATQAGVGMTKNDPSLWLRQYNNISAIFSNNVIGKRGYWTYKDGGLEKLYDFNWGTLQKNLEKRQEFDLFNNWLVARDQHFRFNELAKMREELQKAKMDPRIDTSELRKSYNELNEQLLANGFSEEVVRNAYLENKDRFAKEEEMYDKLVRADLDFLHSSDVGLISDEEYERLTAKEGYASLKRQFYDEVIGDESPRGKGIAGPRPSSLKHRKGSSRTIIAPVYSGVKNHAEMLRKGLKQVVYNKIVQIAKLNKHPDLFQQQSLKAIPDPETGAFVYPQEKDPNIIMGRMPGGKRVPVLVDGWLKKTIDELLDFKNIGTFEKLFMGASRFFTKGTTGLFPAFTVTNFTIDQVAAVSQTQQNYIPVYSPIKEMFKIMQDSNSPEARFFEEYMVMGGERQTIIGWQDMSAKELAEKISYERKGMLKVIDLLNRGADIVSIPQKYSEIITRSVEYVKARQAGDSQIVALEKAGRVTTPFHHIGRLGGTQFVKTIVKSIPFLNPAIQVFAQAYRSLLKSGKRQSARFLFVTLAVTAANIAAFAVFNARGTKKQKDAYKDLEPNELAKYLWLPASDGETLTKLRLPDILNMPGTIANMAMADQIMDTKYTAGDYMTAATAFLPTQMNILEPARALLSWIPQIVKPAIMVAVNKKDFPSVRPLESDAQMRKPVSLRIGESTPPVTTTIAQKLHLDKLGISPIKLDYLLTGYAGRITGFATGKKGIYNPIKSALTKEYYFTSGRRLQQFYDDKKENDQQYAMIRKEPKEYSLEERSKIAREHRRLENIESIIDKYRQVDETKDPLRAELLRDKILRQIEKL